MRQIKYTRVIPYQVLGGNDLPIVPVRLQNGGRYQDALALVGSGADSSVFNLDLAHALGVPISVILPQQARGVGGASNLYLWDMHIVVFGRRMRVQVGFSSTCPREFGLLGRADFFTAYQVGFDQPSKTLLLHDLPLGRP